MLACGLAAAPGRAAEPVKVVASFSILADMVREVGGDRVEVRALVGPNGDTHVYQPTPADAKALAEAKVLVFNGLGLEGWMTRLQQSSGFKGLLVTASTGVKPQQMEDDHGHGHGHGHAHGKSKTVPDPHAWQSLANGKLYAQNIRDGLIKADPDGKATYEVNAAKFIAAIEALEPEVKRTIARIPAAQRKIITSHDAFGYFGRAYGLKFISAEGVSTENAASAQDVAKIIRQIRAEKISAVFVENVTDKRLLEQIGRESGARIGGTLFSDALSAPDGPAPTYLEMFRHNLRTLSAAMSS
jgi:zinc/manganese transport system substrate-binding protein